MKQLRHAALAAGGPLGLAAAFLTAWSGGAAAAKPEPWQLYTLPPATPVAADVMLFHDWLVWLIFAIAIFVLGLMVYVCIRFRAARNPNPSRTTHNTVVEVLWTAIPVLILVVVAVPSFRVLYLAEKVADPDMTVKIVANQWYWTYEYPDEGVVFDSYMLAEDEIDPATQTYLLDVDNPLVLPTGRKIQLLVTSNDVMHSFFLPAAVVQTYAIAGRVNEGWIEFDRETMVYGQCNQICGVNHSAMPIVVRAVGPEAWESWLETAKVEFAAAPAPVRVAGRTGARPDETR